MSVTFGTPVEVDYANVTSMALAMSGVTSGQPIVVVYSTLNAPNAPTGISDSFSTPYTWTVVDSESTTATYLRTYIGTGGAGTSGTITLTCAASTYPGAVAIPCIGASTASGLLAIDVHGGQNVSLTESLTPGAAGEGAVYAADAGSGGISTSPGSPWVDTQVHYLGAACGSVATYASPTSGSPLSATWTTSGSAYLLTAGLIVKAALPPLISSTSSAVLGDPTANLLWPGAPSSTAGTGSQTSSITGSAVGVAGVAGTAAQTSTVTSTATGVVEVPAAGSQTSTITGSALGVVTIAGTAAQTSTVTGLATGNWYDSGSFSVAVGDSPRYTATVSEGLRYVVNLDDRSRYTATTGDKL